MGFYISISIHIFSILTLLIVRAYSKKSIGEKSKKAQYLNIMSRICSIGIMFEIIVAYFMHNEKFYGMDLSIIKFSMVSIFTLITCMHVLYLCFLHYYLKPYERISKNYTLMFIVPLYINVAILLATALTGNLLNVGYNEQRELVMQRGTGFAFFGIIQVMYFVITEFFIWYNYKNFNNLELIILSTFLAYSVLGTLIQLPNDQLHLTYEGFSTGLVLIYIFLHDKLVSIDRMTDLITKSEFSRKYKNIKDRNYYIAMVELKNYEEVLKNYGEKEARAYLIDFSKCIKKIDLQSMEMCHDKNDLFFAYFDTDDLQMVNKIFIDIQTEVNKFNESTNGKYNIQYIYQIELVDVENSTLGKKMNEAFMNLYEMTYAKEAISNGTNT